MELLLRLTLSSAGATFFNTTESGTLAVQRASITCTIASDTNCTGKGTATILITNAIPAGSLVLGVDARVTTILAGSDGLATFDIGYDRASGIPAADDTDAFGVAVAVAATTTTGIARLYRRLAAVLHGGVSRQPDRHGRKGN